MLFSSPDYPLFLIAVFFLYALSRQGGAAGRWARIAVMVLLGDLVVVLVSKDPNSLWDPLGGVLYRLVGYADAGATWPGSIAWQWPIGLAVLLGALELGRRRGAWIGSDRGQAWVARGLVIGLVVVASTVAIASQAGELDAVTARLAAHAHLLVLFVLGVGLGAAQDGATRPLGRIVILFVASSLFYHAWAAAMPGPYRYLLGVLLATIVLDYYLAIWIERTEHPVARRALVIVSLCSNLGILFFFKYTNFLTQDVLHLPVKPLHLILPAGISFHTFQSLSYTIDVYRRQLRATRSVVQFATFVLFFPQLVAGPIVRAQDLLPQLAELPPLDLAPANAGMFRIVVGLFKKIMLADTLALVIVDRVFEAPERFSGLEVLAGVYGYALQIYLDFSAYSDIAIGSAQVLGFTLPENFRTPYRSGNLQEFWRRWHISLSTWLRDYLYITLGGSKGAAWRTYLNLSLTMVLGGLWHGASWTFVVWGALHGFGLAVTRLFQRAARKLELVAGLALVAAAGLAIQRLVVPDDTGTWTQLVLAWLYLTPLWAVLTAWLGAEPPVAPITRSRDPIADGLRLAMCAAGGLLLVGLTWWDDATWLPLALAMWGFGIAADLVERGAGDAIAFVKRAVAVVLVFHYVCLGWIFFRATSFDNALAIIRRLGALIASVAAQLRDGLTGATTAGPVETDHANLVPIVILTLALGFACHWFADGSFRWLRDRFVALPPPAQGVVLGVAALALRTLAHTQIVPFIYFQF